MNDHFNQPPPPEPPESSEIPPSASGPSKPPQGRLPVNPSGAMPPPPPPPQFALSYPPVPPPGRGRLGRVLGRSLTGILVLMLVLSVAFNLWFVIQIYTITSRAHEETFESGEGAGRIVILPIDGMLDDENADFVRQAVQVLRKDKPEAIVLRVNSLGGTVGASDRVWNHLVSLRDDLDIPIVASMGTVATSGGYYVLASADWIFAEPTTITGSIGVIGPFFTIENLLNKIGVTPETVVATHSQKKDLGSAWRQWTDQDRKRWTELLDHSYERFIEIVHQGRQKHLTMEQVREVATGDVYNADEAVQYKLIDAKGYLSDAIDKAKELASMVSDRPKITIMRRPVNLGLLGLSGLRRTMPQILSEQIRRVLVEMTTPRLEYR